MGRINRLIPTTTLTANSVIAMDAESGGATNKVTIQTLAAGLRSFGDYATQAQLAAKQDVLTFDDSPEEDSDNPVTSGGIYNAIGNAMGNVYTKAETDNAIAQSTAFFVAVDTLAELESALVTKWSAMSNGGSIQGSVWTTFSNASMGFNSGVYTVALFRRTNGVYLATFITTTATVISDYYYSGVHHWSSQLSDKAVVSDLTGAASGVTTHGNYVYDPSAQTVRIYLASRSANDMGPSTVLANIPAAYRPKSTVYLVGFYTTGGSGVAYQGRVETNGNVTQTLGSSVREAIIVGEYSIA